ncbi:hypothetical protein ACI48J_03675 [Paenibacillus chitinolyticus]|uniref:hypothetical protein n=1 Tax=Paenibacillus chitinolyticus TaxID=79263 RepID=UPI00386D5856
MLVNERAGSIKIGLACRLADQSYFFLVPIDKKISAKINATSCTSLEMNFKSQKEVKSVAQSK